MISQGGTLIKMSKENNSIGKQNLAKLEKIFSQVSVYNGDRELISNVNSEYNIDPTDIICTDGMVNFSVQKVNSDNEIHYDMGIRGASYLIVVEKIPTSESLSSITKSIWRYSLYVNRMALTEKYEEIVNRYNHMVSYMLEMKYYIEHWKNGQNILENGHSIYE